MRTYMRRRTQRVYEKPLPFLSTVHFSIVNFSLLTIRYAGKKGIWQEKT